MINLFTIGEQIRTLRKGRGLTQQDLAEKLNLKRSTIANYEINRRSISLEDLIKLADFFGVDLNYFGINEDKNAIFDLLSRAELIFRSNKISELEKEELHHALLKLYLKIKELHKGDK